MAAPPIIPPSAPDKPSILSRLSVPGRIGLSVFFVSVIGLGYWLVFHTEVTGKIESAKKQQDQLRGQLVEKQQAQASYVADLADLEIREQRARSLNRILPSEKQQPAFLSAIQLAANTSGIDLKVFNPLEEQPQPYFIKDPMRLEISGRFHQVVKFVYEVGKLDRVINMENIELFDPKMVGEEIVLRGRCLATAFHAIPPKKAPVKK